MRLDPSVDDERSGATPVLVAREFAHTVDVSGRVAARKCHPQKIVQRAGGKVGVVDDDNQR